MDDFISREATIKRIKELTDLWSATYNDYHIAMEGTGESDVWQERMDAQPISRPPIPRIRQGGQGRGSNRMGYPLMGTNKP